MRFEVENIGALKRKISVEIPAETVGSEIEAAYTKLKGQVKMDGFRKGKVPRSVLERYYKDHVIYDVTNKLINDSFNEALIEKEIIPVSDPEIEADRLAAGSPFKYSATIEVRPDVDVKGYEGMKIEKEKVSVAEAMVDERIQALRRQNLTLKTVERALKDGDTAVIDFEGFMDGVAFQGGKGERVPLKIGSGRFIPGFEEQLVGMKAGDEREIAVKFPTDYNHKDFAGKDATFKVRLNEVKEEILPEIDDEFAKDMGYQTLDELKTHIRGDMEKEKEAEAKGKMKDRIIDALIESNPFEAPQSMIKKQKDFLVDDLKKRYGRAGLEMEKEIEKSEISDNLEKAALKQVKGAIIISGVARKEGIKVTDADVNEKLTAIASEHNVGMSDIKSYYEKNKLFEPLRRQILEDKVFDAVISKGKVVEI